MFSMMTMTVVLAVAPPASAEEETPLAVTAPRTFRLVRRDLINSDTMGTQLALVFDAVHAGRLFFGVQGGFGSYSGHGCSFLGLRVACDDWTGPDDELFFEPRVGVALATWEHVAFTTALSAGAARVAIETRDGPVNRVRFSGSAGVSVIGRIGMFAVTAGGGVRYLAGEGLYGVLTLGWGLTVPEDFRTGG